MKNKMYVFKTALAVCLVSVVAASAVMIAPTVGVNAAALTNGPIYFDNTTGGRSAVNPDGTSATVPTFIKGTPSFSPDGTRVTWVELANAAYNVMVAGIDGTNKTTLATSPTMNDIYLRPQFSADGQKIIFLTKSNSTTSIVEVTSATANQTPTTIVAAGAQASNITVMSLSVNGDIAFIANGCGGTAGVYVRRADGNYTNTTSPLANTCSAAGASQKTASSVIWNNDGSKLFVLRKDFGAQNAAIFVADPVSGITTTPILTIGSSGDGLALSPDGTKIAFSEWSGSSLQISVMNIDGANKVGPWTVTGQGSYLSPIAWGIPTSSSSGNGSTPSSGSSASPSTNSGSTTNNNSPSTNVAPTTDVVPGVTVTDTKIYTQAPAKVASSSAVSVLTSQQTRTQRIVSKTPSVCVPTKDDIVFIDEGRCSASILSKKSGKVLRQFRTTVVEDEVSELKVGNEVSIVAPIYFDAESTDVNSRGIRRIRGLASQINAAGEILVVGHSGIAMGDTPENRRLSHDRAVSTVKAIKKVGAAGPFTVLGVGSKSPAVTSTKGKDQAKNRRTVIILVP